MIPFKPGQRVINERTGEHAIVLPRHPWCRPNATTVRYDDGTEWNTLTYELVAVENTRLK